MNGGLGMSYTFCEKKVGGKLHELRMRKKLKQREAADEMHISCEHYSRIENGTRRISLEMLFILMNFYGEDANTIVCIKDGKYVE
jgi:transcriptional regulator with XRE-family HTH domain